MLPGSQKGLIHTSLTIHSTTGSHLFDVEVAASPQEQMVGMMFRRNVPPDSGMIFLYPEAQPLTFWMKNTLVPLDLIFIDSDHRILNVAASAEPLSLDPIASSGPAIAVLEIAGGRAAQLGIKAGDRVDW